MILGLLPPTSGHIAFAGARLPAAPGRELRRRMQLVFQDPYSSPDPRRRVGSQIADGLAIHKLAPAAERPRDPAHQPRPGRRAPSLRPRSRAVSRPGNEDGPAEQLFPPHHPYTRALLSASPQLDPGARRARIVLQGEPPSPSAPPSGCVFRTRCPHAAPVCAEAVPALREAAPGQRAACVRDQVVRC